MGQKPEGAHNIRRIRERLGSGKAVLAVNKARCSSNPKGALSSEVLPKIIRLR